MLLSIQPIHISPEDDQSLLIETSSCTPSSFLELITTQLRFYMVSPQLSLQYTFVFLCKMRTPVETIIYPDDRKFDTITNFTSWYLVWLILKGLYYCIGLNTERDWKHVVLIGNKQIVFKK